MKFFAAILPLPLLVAADGDIKGAFTRPAQMMVRVDRFIVVIQRDDRYALKPHDEVCGAPVFGRPHFGRGSDPGSANLAILTLRSLFHCLDAFGWI